MTTKGRRAAALLLALLAQAVSASAQQPANPGWGSDHTLVLPGGTSIAIPSGARVQCGLPVERDGEMRVQFMIDGAVIESPRMWFRAEDTTCETFVGQNGYLAAIFTPRPGVNLLPAVPAEK